MAIQAKMAGTWPNTYYLDQVYKVDGVLSVQFGLVSLDLSWLGVAHQ